jgi:hypothetical protein
MIVATYRQCNYIMAVRQYLALLDPIQRSILN